MLVHAHPDDEAIPTGATMASYARQGVSICLVTCTRGERGEIVDEGLAQLRDAGPEELGQHREIELAAALAELGNPRHEFLGGPGRWWDSGMAGTPDNDDPRAFHRADPAETLRAMVEVIRRERPDVVICDDDRGSYGHPDHVQAHRVTMAALEPAGDPGYAPELGQPWTVRKVYWTAIPRAAVQRMVAEAGLTLGDDMPGVPDEAITTQVDGRPFREAKLAALRAHRSQVNLTDGFFAKVAQRPELGLEHFRLVRGERGPAGPGEQGWEDDLFAGL
ncbi:MAG TPA: N-acetyl-1-D-myo-inositol-2-amino-2-deoxy-alpha-D-glucopyranoside deacetylase [Pseudonocardia sp.]